jgi:hypothetical protein
MRKLKIIEHISLDGVIQHSTDKGDDGDFPHSDWTAPFAWRLHPTCAPPTCAAA